MCPNANKTAIRAYTLHENPGKKLLGEGKDPSMSIFFSILLEGVFTGENQALRGWVNALTSYLRVADYTAK